MKRYIRAAVRDLSEEPKDLWEEIALESSDPYTLRQLYDCTGPGDRAFYYALTNPNMPKDILIKESDSPNERIRECVAHNTNTPTEILIKLSTDFARAVRGAIMLNPSTSEAILRSMLNQNYMSTAYIMENPNAPEDILCELAVKYPEERFRLAKNPNAPINLLQEYIADNENKIDYGFVNRAKDNLRARGYPVE